MTVAEQVLVVERQQPRLKSTVGPLIALLGALGITVLLLLALQVNPLSAYGSMVMGAIGSGQSISDTLTKFIPIGLIALGVGLNFRCGLWNAGGDGQFYAGAIGAGVVGILINAAPIPLIALELLAGVAGGCLAAMLPAILKTRFGTNEIVVTLMFNFVPILLLAYIIQGPLSVGWTSKTVDLHAAGLLPWTEVFGVRIHAGLLVVVLAVVGLYVVMAYTTFGYRIRAIGSNMRAAENSGISVRWTQFVAFLIAGGLAGAAGMIQVTAIHHNLVDGMSAGFGFTAIVAALLGRLKPAGVLLASLGFAALVVGGDSMQRTAQIQNSVVFVIQGLILFFLLAGRIIGRESVQMSR